MYRFNEIKDLHLEISSRCQASCPMCSRNYHGGMTNPLLQEVDWSLDFAQSILNNEVLSQVLSINLCGNYGDPILNNDLISIIKYIVEKNKMINISIHTNGSARHKSWWKELALSLPKSHLVNFAIDGLEDTHSLYRIGTSYNKIIENAKEFIRYGGKARWVFITFKHNEHQINTAKELAKKLGFKSFYEKQSTRFIGNPYFEVLDKSGKVTHKLELPKENKLIFIDTETIKRYKEIMKDVKIDCAVKKSKSLYIDAFGFLWPCCFVGSVPYRYAKSDQLVHQYHEDSKNQFNHLIFKLGGMESLNLNKKSIREIIDNNKWQSIWESNLNEDSLLVCTRTCGKFPNPTISKSQDQFINLETFYE